MMVVEKVISNYFENKNVLARFFHIALHSNRPGPSFTAYQKYYVVKGGVNEILLNQNYNYPITDEEQWLLIPQTNIVVIEFEWYDETTEEGKEIWWEVFHAEHGWAIFEDYKELKDFLKNSKIRKLDETDVRKILQEILDNERFKEERKWFIDIKEWIRPGDSFEDRQYIGVLHGKVQKIFVDSYYNYPTDNWERYFIIPVKGYPIILVRRSYDYGVQNGSGAHQYIVAFTFDGWKEIKQYSW